MEVHIRAFCYILYQVETFLCFLPCIVQKDICPVGRCVNFKREEPGAVELCWPAAARLFCKQEGQS